MVIENPVLNEIIQVIETGSKRFEGLLEKGRKREK